MTTCPGKLALCRRGVTALETAIVIPVMLLLILGLHEIYMYVRTVALVERAAYSVADIMSRQTNALIDCSTSANSLNLGTYVEAARQLASPLTLSRDGAIYMSALKTVNGSSTVMWRRHSVTGNSFTSFIGPGGSTATNLPAGVAPEGLGGTLIVVEVFYEYDPFSATRSFWPTAPGKQVISRRSYYSARLVDLGTLVADTGCTPLPS
jgi:TadE-like protein.